MQIELGDKYLHIQGFVSPTTIGQMAKSLTPQPNAQWFFVEYAPATYPKGVTFNFVIDDRKNKMEQGYFNLRLLNIVDQFGYSQDEISEGWKTICQFAIDNMPLAMTSLPVLDTWKYNPNGIKLLSFSDFNFFEENVFSEKLFSKAISQIMSLTFHASTDKRRKFADSLWNIIDANKDEIVEKASPDFIRKVENTLHSF